jgi:hypothetical protein
MQMRYLLSVIAAIAALAQQPVGRPPLPRNYRTPYYSVSGVVRDADTNEPIVGARVKLQTQQQRLNLSEEDVVTKLGGAFSAIFRKEDRLWIRVDAEGYVESTADIERGPLVIVAQPGRDRESVEIRLHRAAEIEGQLFDLDLEKPVQSVTVRAHWSVWDRGRRVLKPAGEATSSNAEGRFRLTGLPPADYFLEIVQKEQERIEERAGANRKPIEGYAREYWPGGGMLGAAIPLQVLAGARLPLGGVFIRKSRMYRVHGELVSSVCRETMRYRMLLWEHREERFILRNNTLVPCNSTFTVHNLVPGRWTLETELQGVLPRQAESSSVDLVVNDKDQDLEVHPLFPLPIEGKLRGVRPEVKALLKPKGRPEYVPPELPAREAAWDFIVLAPATEFAQITLPKLPEQYCIREILYNGGATDDGAFRVNREAPSQLIEITLSDKPATLTGRVIQKEKPVPGAIVVIAPWPVALRTDWPKTIRTAAGDDGKFSFKGLAPGAWRIFAVHPALRQKLEQPGFLLGLIGRAEEYTLAESDVKTVELKTAEP